MPYDPDDFSTAEPKLLSLDCFPVLFIQPVLPPDYDIIMAGNTRYHRISEDMRQSIESLNPELDAGLLLLDPARRDDYDTPPKKEFRFSCHPTFFFRLITACCFLISFVLLIVGDQVRNIPSIIFACFAMIRNILVVLHHVCSKQLRIKFSIEWRNQGVALTKPKRSCPGWLKQGIFHVLLDFIFIFVLLSTTIVLHDQLVSDWRWHYGTDLSVAACVLVYVGEYVLHVIHLMIQADRRCSGFYLLSIFDLGKPSNITTSNGIAFDYGNKKDGNRPGQPRQVYRDVEAAGGLTGVESRKSGEESPVII